MRECHVAYKSEHESGSRVDGTRAQYAQISECVRMMREERSVGKPSEQVKMMRAERIRTYRIANAQEAVIVDNSLLNNCGWRCNSNGKLRDHGWGNSLDNRCRDLLVLGSLLGARHYECCCEKCDALSA